MAATYQTYVSDGTTRTFAVPFPYLNKTHVKVSVDGVLIESFVFLSDSLIQLAIAPASESVVEVRRKTPAGVVPVDFTDGSVLDETDLDTLARYASYLSEEAADIAAGGLFVGPEGTFDAGGRGISNVAPSGAPNGLPNKAQMDAYVTDAEASRDSAATSSASAASSAQAAAISSSSAAASAQAAADISQFIPVLAGETGAARVGYTPGGTGAVVTNVQAHLRDRVHAANAGIIGDGVTDNTAAFALMATRFPGKTIWLPSGVYVGRISSNTLNGVLIEGENKYTTEIRCPAGVNDHAVALSTGAANCSIKNITINQNRVGKTGGHGIRLGGVDGLTIDGVIIKSCYSYGIGVQAGTNKNVSINDFEIFDCGRDGIDVKDLDLANEGVTITNGRIYNYGDNATNQAGFDIRGPAIVSNVHVRCDHANNRGFRFRSGGVQGRPGSGSADNINILLSGASGQYGFNTEGETNDNLTISNIVTRGAMLGVISSSGGSYKNLTAYGVAASESLSVAGSNNTIDGLIIDGSTRGIDMEPGASNNTISNFNIKNITGTEAVRIQSTANENVFVNGQVQSGKLLSDSGTGTTIRDVKNWKTSGRYITGDLLVDSTGTRVTTIAHDLSVTPNPEDVVISIVRSTGSPTDYRIGLIHIDGNPTSSQIGVRLVVLTASVTAGAAVRIVAHVRAKNA